ncbi:FAD/NAD(P)-binding domain-containing protein [Stipitochalara longipes BDJ]|nr:FAD/NAD(P)-binding domain-containing protein [Stipitochalara longipes BDJ]
MPFKIVIVGTGIAGLGAAIALADKGHNVTIVEATSQLQPIGGIIVLQANASRVLDKLGVYQYFLATNAPTPFKRNTRRYKDGRLLIERHAEAYEKEYGYPLWPVYRADLQQTLYQTAVERGVTLRLGCTVVGIDDNKHENVTVVIKGGEELEADVVVGADGESERLFLGIKSTVRKYIFPNSISLRDSGMDVTRVNIPDSIVKSDPKTSIFMNQISSWYGPFATLAIIPVRRGDEWFLGLDCCHRRDDNSVEGGSRKRNIEKFREHFKDFAPAVQKLLSYVKDAHVWRMAETIPESWVSESGRVVLIGDAAHAILPWVGQGGGIALEDTVTLAECLDRAELTQGIPKVLKAFQEIREPRCRLVQEWSAIKGKRATIPDGFEQVQRDKNFKAFNAWVKTKPWDGVHIDKLPELESLDWKAWLNGHDAVGFANRELDKRFPTCK